MAPRHIVQAVAIAILWGTNFIAVKLGTAVFPPLFMVGLRFVLVAILIVPFATRPRRDQLGSLLAISCLLGVLHFGLTFIGLRQADVSNAAIASQLGVPFTTILSVIFLGDRLGWRRVLGIAVAFSGVVILAGTPHVSANPWPIACILGASMAFAAGTILIKRLGPFEPATLNGWSALFAGPQLLVISALLEHGQWAAVQNADATAWLSLAYIAIGSSVIAYGLWYKLLTIYSVSQAMPFMLLVPVCAVLSGILVLGEPVTWPLVLGAALTIGGVGAIEIRQIRRGRFIDPAPNT